MINSGQFIEQSTPFIDWMVNWYNNIDAVTLSDLTNGNADRVGIISVDVIKGFCNIGPLSSERVNQIVEPISALFKLAWDAGVKNIVLTQDTHSELASEFAVYPPHCIRGTVESQSVDAFMRLPFYNQIKIVEKNSLSSTNNTELDAWMDSHPEITTWVIVGDCTDLCVYNLVMHIRTRTHAFDQRGIRIVVPINAVDTFDTSVETANRIKIPAHDANFLHMVFLYHMMTNGVEIVREITA